MAAVSAHSDLCVRPIRAEDSADWLRLRCAHWPDGADDHPGEIAAFFAGSIEEPAAVFVAERDGRCVGVKELSIRSDLPGIAGQKTAYVEGLYVLPEFRGGNVVRLLLRTAQDWARENRCVAFASDRAGRIVVDRKYSERSDE